MTFSGVLGMAAGHAASAILIAGGGTGLSAYATCITLPFKMNESAKDKGKQSFMQTKKHDESRAKTRANVHRIVVCSPNRALCHLT